MLMAPMQQWTPYCGAGPAPAELWARWNADPVLIGLLAAAAFACARWGRPPGAKPVLLGLAILTLAVSFVSPLCALSSALFSARVVHHLLLVAVAAPLLAWGAARTSAPSGGLGLWTAVHVLVFAGWHAPAAYEAALGDDRVYWIMQVSLLASACGFWGAVRAAPTPAAAAGLLVVMVQMGLIGALLTFAPRALYAPHLLTTAAWGLSPLADQQLGGLIMWAPGALIYLGAALVLGWRFLGADPRPAAAR